MAAIMAASLQLTSNRTGSRMGAGCLALFALPFAAVGVGALAWASLTVLDWWAASDWAVTPAEIVSVELEEHDDDDGATTYKATATYRYEYAGRTYTNNRVAIDFGSDNIGDFQQQLYNELRSAHERQSPVTAYVDPAEPTSAVLNRELRFGMARAQGRLRPRVRRRRLQPAVRRADRRQEARGRARAARAVSE
jgi:hypothetical protein